MHGRFLISCVCLLLALKAHLLLLVRYSIHGKEADVSILLSKLIETSVVDVEVMLSLVGLALTRGDALVTGLEVANRERRAS